MNRADESYQILLQNNTSGSSDILKRTLQWLHQALEEGQQQAKILLDLESLCKTHVSMALLQNLSLFLHEKELTTDRIEFWRNACENHEKTSCRIFASHLSDFTNILIHSYSGLLYESIKQVSKTLNVYCTESRPAFEGRLLADKLAETHHKIYLISDMASFSVLRRVEIAAFGCDSITPRGIVNKIGTAALAEISQRHGKMNYFIGTTDKIIDHWDDDFLLRQGSREEIYRGNGTVQVENYYFDLTPPQHIGGLFLETGLSRMFDDAKTTVSRR